MSKTATATRKFYFSTGAGNYGTINSEHQFTWQEISDSFSKRPEVAAKNTGFYVFGQFKDSKRNRSKLISRSALVLDLERQKDTTADVNAALDILKERLAGYKALWHTTYQYDADNNMYRYRVIIPLEKDITGEEYTTVASALTRGIENSLDPRSLLPEQCSYLPAVSHDKAFYGCWLLDGEKFYSSNEALHTLRKLGEEISPDSLPIRTDSCKSNGVIKEGNRNNHLSSYAFSVLKRWGAGDIKAKKQFLVEANKCRPPLAQDEIKVIWYSALIAHKKKTASDPNYIMPEIYGSSLPYFKQSLKDLLTDPFDFTDVGVSNLFNKGYREHVRFSKALNWIVWNGRVWRANELAAQEAFKELTAVMLDDSNNKIKQAHTRLGEAEISKDQEAIDRMKKEVASAKAYKRFALKTRHSNRVSGALKLASSAMEIDIKDCDNDPYLLNTPAGIIDLETGEVKSHDPSKYCTKITNFAPADASEGPMWKELLDTVTQGDTELQSYIKAVIGAALIGKVYTETIVIAYGGGANGKSTLFNAFYSVLGDYAGKMPADALTTSKNMSYKNTLAELPGKRLIIASETEEGQRISNSMLKKVASSDAIVGERKHRDPFEFFPSHQVVLYTNFLPRVSGNDHGTWRRLAVIPFNATIANPQTDYLERLLAREGEVILRWMVEGAKKFIDLGRKLPQCMAVNTAINKYKDDNDWLTQFLNENCIIGDKQRAKSGDLYCFYNNWAKQSFNWARNKADFKTALEERGFIQHRESSGVYWLGLSLAQSSTETNGMGYVSQC